MLVRVGVTSRASQANMNSPARWPFFRSELAPGRIDYLSGGVAATAPDWVRRESGGT